MNPAMKALLAFVFVLGMTASASAQRKIESCKMYLPDHLEMYEKCLQWVKDPGPVAKPIPPLLSPAADSTVAQTETENHAKSAMEKECGNYLPDQHAYDLCVIKYKLPPIISSPAEIDADLSAAQIYAKSAEQKQKAANQAACGPYFPKDADCAEYLSSQRYTLLLQMRKENAERAAYDITSPVELGSLEARKQAAGLAAAVKYGIEHPETMHVLCDHPTPEKEMVYCGYVTKYTPEEDRSFYKGW